MLDTSPENLLKEVQSAEEHNLKHLTAFPDLIQTLVGSYYRSDMLPISPSPENYPYTYVANVKPRLVFNNPRFNASSESTFLKSEQVLAQAKFVNRWTVQQNLQRLLDPYVATALLLRSVILTTFDDDTEDAGLPETEMRRKIPRCHLLENHRYFRDPVSTPATPPRYKGHIWVRDLEDVKKMPGVDKKTVEKLIPDVELKKLMRPDNTHGHDTLPPRFEILAYEVWVPECNDYATNRGHNGTIFTIACGQAITHSPDGGKVKKRFDGAAYLLPPRPYYGPKWGPYTELEYVEVPGQTYGTSPVSVVMAQVEEVNAHLVATAEAAGRMKHLVIIDAANDTLQVAVQNSPDGMVLGVPNVGKDQINQVLIGGPAPEQYQYNEAARERLDRNIGMDAAQRGGQVGNATATATNVQYQTLNVRMDDLKRITTRSVMQIANTVSWYGWESNNVVMRLGADPDDESGFQNPVYLGGPGQGEQLPPWDAAALQLEPYSMQPVDEEQLAQQVTEALAIIAQLAQEMQTAPWLNYDILLEQLGKLRKFEWMSECINAELFAEWMKEQTQQQMEQHQSEQQAQQMELQMQQVKVQGMMLDNAKKKIEMMQMLHEQAQGPQTQDKPPSVAINYADLPEDMKRDAEMEAFGTSSTMPLTARQHIQNAMDVHKTNAGMQQERGMQRANQQHDSQKQASQQQHQVKQSKLAGMLKGMGDRKKNSGGMKTASSRAQSGPLGTAKKGQKALQASR